VIKLFHRIRKGGLVCRKGSSKNLIKQAFVVNPLQTEVVLNAITLSLRAFNLIASSQESTFVLFYIIQVGGKSFLK